MGWLGKWILYFILRLLAKTCRFIVFDEHHYQQARSLHPSQNYILAFWHEQLLAPLFFFQGSTHTVLASRSGGGQLIGFLCKRFGNYAVFGSQNRNGKDKGGLRALISLLNELRDRGPVAVTVDGSIGPRRFAKAGVFDVARKSQAAILPLTGIYSRSWILNTWDRFQIPKPFSTIIIKFGAPIRVSSDMKKHEVESLQIELNSVLNRQEQEARDLYLSSVKSKNS